MEGYLVLSLLLNAWLIYYIRKVVPQNASKSYSHYREHWKQDLNLLFLEYIRQEFDDDTKTRIEEYNKLYELARKNHLI